MRTALGLVFASSLSLAAARQASADSLHSGGGARLAETSHTVEVSVAGGVATYRVRRVLANRGKADDEATLEINLPHGAAATGLRTRTGKTWHDAELIDAEQAEARYHAPGGGGRPGATALLSWFDSDQLGLTVFPVPARGTTTIEYTLTVPTRYRRGQIVLAYPLRIEGDEDGTLADPVLTVRRGGDVTGATLRMNGRRIATGAPSALRSDACCDGVTDDHADDDQDQHDLYHGADRGKPSHEFEDLTGNAAELALSPPPIDSVALRLGRVVASPTQAFGRLDVDVAPVLRPLPKRAQVVFVLDASRSGRVFGGLEDQLALVSAYVSHVPDAEVELVLFRRAATRLFGAFIPARSLNARLAAARAAGKLALGNGSALDEGVRLAAETIATVTGPRRIVMVTDTMLRARWDNAAAITALAAAPADTVVHLVSTAGSPWLVRDDDHALAPIVAGHHGIVARLGGSYGDDDDDREQRARAVLGLVRPVQIDHVERAGFDSDPSEPVPPTLREGRGLRLTVMDRDAPAHARLRGMIWGDPFETEVTADPRFSTATAAWVAASAYVQTSDDEDDPGLLSKAEVRAVAMIGRAVSPVTSYLVSARAVPPETGGGTGSGYGVCGGHGGMRGRIAAMPARAPRTVPDPMALVAGAARACTAKHAPPPAWKVSLTMESTFDEIVDVIVDGGGDLAITPCLVDAVWAAELTRAFNLPRERFALTFQ